MSTETGLLLPSEDQGATEILRNSFYRTEALRVSLAIDSSNIYSKIYRGSTYGLGICSGTFYNEKIGDPVGAFVFAKIPLVRNASWNIFSEIGGGLAGNFNPYHETLNPNNVMLGSRINMVGHITIGAERYIFKSFKIAISTGYKHYSNGFLKAPNYGINIAPITLIGSYDFTKNKMSPPNAEIEPFKSHHRFSIFIGPGTKSYSNREPNYFVSTLGLQYINQTGYKIGIGGGLDLFYKDSGKDKTENGKNDFSNSCSAGINTSFEWIFTEKFRLNLGAGLYIFRHPENDEAYIIYERLATRYYLTKNIFAGIGIKVNYEKSDFVEWTLGYTFMRDKNKYQ